MGARDGARFGGAFRGRRCLSSSDVLMARNLAGRWIGLCPEPCRLCWVRPYILLCSMFNRMHHVALITCSSDQLAMSMFESAAMYGYEALLASAAPT